MKHLADFDLRYVNEMVKNIKLQSIFLGRFSRRIQIKGDRQKWSVYVWSACHKGNWLVSTDQHLRDKSLSKMTSKVKNLRLSVKSKLFTSKDFIMKRFVGQIRYIKKLKKRHELSDWLIHSLLVMANISLILNTRTYKLTNI